MITAIDTNVLLDILGTAQEHGGRSQAALERCLDEGVVVAGDVVWAETSAWFPDSDQLAIVLDRMGIVYLPTSADAALAAGQLWRRYRISGGTRERLAPDFLVGAHALTQADRLLTRDRGFFRRYFAGLTLIDPARAGSGEAVP